MHESGWDSKPCVQHPLHPLSQAGRPGWRLSGGGEVEKEGEGWRGEEGWREEEGEGREVCLGMSVVLQSSVQV